VTTVAPTERTSTGRALLAPALSGGLGLIAAVVLHLRDPHDSGSYGFCPFLSLTGLPCPGCGGLRAVNDLTRGDLVAAVSSNLLAVVLVVGLALLWAVWFVRRAGGQRRARFIAVSTRTAMLVLPVVAVFGVLRVTPWGSWLAP